jgi:hypothetical protein
MHRTYKAVLRGGRVEWIDPPPSPNGPTPVQITLLDGENRSGRVREMAAALEALAAAGGVSGIADPVAWQRQIREDTGLPGRES